MKQHPATAMLGISLVIMLIALDQTVVGTALPSIVADLKAYSLYPWIAAVYLGSTLAARNSSSFK